MNRIFGKSIVVGVDASPQSLRAAAVAWRIAEAARTKCQLVHAVPDVPLARAREIAVRLHRVVPSAVARALDVRYGRAARVLAEAVARHGAGLVVLGGKRRGTIARALSGSTAHYLVRTLDVPVLVTDRRSSRIGRILVAVDLSSAARATLQVAAALTNSVGARLRVLHVVEPIRYPYVVPRAPDKKAFFQKAVETFRRLAATAGVGESELIAREGSAATTIAAEAARWKADVVVVGSHGKGFVDRLLIGSTTEWLLNRLAASLLVVPIARARRITRRTRPVRRARKRQRAAKAR